MLQSNNAHDAHFDRAGTTHTRSHMRPKLSIGFVYLVNAQFVKPS